jgi:uncharacterized iron-regulated membrane protein
MTARGWFRVHSWIGLMTGLLLFIVCWSGTFATIANEIDWLLTPELRVRPQGPMVSWERLLDAVQTKYPDATVRSLHSPVYPRFAAVAIMDTDTQELVRVYVNPYTGEVLGSGSYFTVQRFFRSLHMHLFIDRAGYYIVGALALALLLSLGTALLFYRRWWKRFLAFRPGRSLRAFWSEAHKLSGLWSLWFVLVIALTGLWYLFEIARIDIGDGKSVWVGPGSQAVKPLPELRAEEGLSLTELRRQAQAVRPELVIRNVFFDFGGYFYVDGQAGHLLVRDRANRIFIHPATGTVVYDQDASDLSPYWRWSDTADPLHFGDFGGLMTKLIWFVFGAGLSMICLTGAYLHAQRLRHDLAGRASWRGTLVAIGAVGGVLIASCRAGVQEIKGYGPLTDGVQHWPEVAVPVVAFLTVWVLITCAMVFWWGWLISNARPVFLDRYKGREPPSASQPAKRLPLTRFDESER